MKIYKIKNWALFQHYKDRNPPWIKLHYELITSRDWIRLDDASKLLAVVCLMLASRNDGKIEDDLEYIKSVAHLRKTPDLKPLIDCGFLALDSECLADASVVQADAIIEERREEDIKKKRRVSLDDIDISHFSDFITENNLCPHKVSEVIPEFIDYWKGVGEKKEDWLATFRNRIRNKKFGGIEQYRKTTQAKRMVV